jgi:hypothetical protein
MTSALGLPGIIGDRGLEQANSSKTRARWRIGMTAKDTGDNLVQVGNDSHEADLAGLVLAQVARRACGRILDLEVDCTDGRITLRGRARTYYAKQLAQQAVLDLAIGRPELSNWIEVDASEPAPRMAGSPDVAGAQAAPF